MGVFLMVQLANMLDVIFPNLWQIRIAVIMDMYDLLMTINLCFAIKTPKELQCVMHCQMKEKHIKHSVNVQGVSNELNVSHRAINTGIHVLQWSKMSSWHSMEVCFSFSWKSWRQTTLRHRHHHLPLHYGVPTRHGYLLWTHHGCPALYQRTWSSSLLLLEVLSITRHLKFSVHESMTVQKHSNVGNIPAKESYNRFLLAIMCSRHMKM